MSCRRALAGAAIAIISIVLAACGGDQTAESGAPDATTTSASEPEVRTISVSFAGGAVAGGVRTETVPLDEPVRIEVSGDVEEQVHVHTYDLVQDVAPNDPAVIEFTADIPGVHEVELEGSHLLVLELQVEP